MDESILLALHNGIHSDAKEVTVNGKALTVHRHNNSHCRYIDYEDVRFTEEDKRRSTIYASQAKAGWKITWGIRDNGPWYLIQNGTILRNY